MKKLLFAALVFCACTAHAQRFVPIDSGSRVHFVIKNFGINTGGDLSGMHGNIYFNANQPATSTIDVAVNVSTIDTDNGQRDRHLRSEDFFAADRYPEIRIKSTGIKSGADSHHFIFMGTLTIKNVTKPLQFPFTADRIGGVAKFSGSFTIDRMDFGVGGNSATMSDNVSVTLSVIAKPV